MELKMGLSNEFGGAGSTAENFRRNNQHAGNFELN